MYTRLGQNFLVDKNIAKKIAKSADILSSDTVIEIGPGKGILTEVLSQTSKKIIAVEIDRKLAEELIEKYRNQTNIKIVNADFLKYNPPKKLKLKFVANLPYYISSAIIEKILHLNNWDTAVFMIQKEVADRIIAPPGSCDYSVLSIACQIFCSVEKTFNVPGTCFHPKPEVTSTVVKLKRLKNPLIKKNEEKKFFKILKSAFLHRRKTILNSLCLSLHKDKKNLEEKILESGISPLCRAETISIEGFVKLAKVLT
ncbi:MAG: ribosomal RNA small subunit methyltransferase A [Elusimicrobia bacterium]|nr:ribosomal RNA small subunit methyltransferase A [Elusimicrobiota bacterium]